MTTPYPIAPPIEPMLAKLATEVPDGDGFLFEPKWDGFRAIVFRGGGDVFIQSRDLKPLDRYFPEVHTALVAGLPDGCVLDGEIVIATPRGLDFDALQMRLHPAASRVAKLALETPAAFVAFDALAIDGQDLRGLPSTSAAFGWRGCSPTSAPSIHLTPMTRDHGQAVEWLARFEGAGLDGVIAKPVDGTYQPGKRAMIKVKHARTADCVVAGFRWHKDGRDRLVGSLLLGLYDDGGRLQHVGVTSAFTMAMRAQLASELAPLREHALEGHPWGNGRSQGERRDAWRPEPMERRQGPVVGAAAHRARVRSEIRPHAGRPVPPRRGVPALARRQAAVGLRLRPARGHDSLRAFEGLRRV